MFFPDFHIVLILVPILLLLFNLGVVAIADTGMFRPVLDNKWHINVTESNCATVVDITVTKTVYSIVADAAVAKNVYLTVVNGTVTKTVYSTVVDATVTKTAYSKVVDATVAKTVYSTAAGTTVASNRSRNCLFDSCNCLKPNETNGPR